MTEAYLSKVPTREAIRSRLTEIWDYPKYDVPFQRGSVGSRPVTQACKTREPST